MMRQFDYEKRFNSQGEAISWIGRYWTEYRRYIANGLFGYRKFSFKDSLEEKDGTWVAHVTCDALE